MRLPHTLAPQDFHFILVIFQFPSFFYASSFFPNFIAYTLWSGLLFGLTKKKNFFSPSGLAG